MAQHPYEDDQPDGQPCACCGDAAVVEIDRLQGHHVPVKLCGACADGQITVCPGCDSTIWCKDGTRVYTSSSLYCASCCAEHPVIATILDRALRADISRDDVAQVRR